MIQKLTYFSILYFVIVLPITAYASNTLYLLTNTRGILVSHDGQSWTDCNQGLPRKITPLDITSHNNNVGYTLYLTTLNSGLFKYTSRTSQWTNISPDSFKRRSQIPLSIRKYRKITAFSYDTTNPNTLVAATKHTMYRSFNGGKTWKKLKIRGIHPRNYITAMAIKKNTIIVGTSFNGVYIYKNKRLIQKNTGLAREQYSKRLFFTDPIATLEYSGETIYAGTKFGNGLFYTSDKKVNWKPLSLPINQTSYHKKNRKQFYTIHAVKNHNQALYITTDFPEYSILKYSSSNPKAPLSIINYQHIIQYISPALQPIAMYTIPQGEQYPPLLYYFKQYSDYKITNKTASNRFALYASIPAIRKKLETYIHTLKATGHNAVVIDMKDDFGNLYFPTKNKLAHQIGSAKRPVNIKKTLNILKKNNIYTIARVVVFKDPKLFRALNNRYAIYNRRTGRPWKGVAHEYWVDPFSISVHEYNISLAKELEELGFDEIQFDYIRFPSDGPTHLCNFRYRKDPETYKSEILADFLTKAKQKLTIPVSTDIYGFNSWYASGNWIGQDMEEFANIVDVICPMVYPSHFGSHFYKKGIRSQRPFNIIYDGGRRALVLSGNSIIRPYLQAFKMLSPTWGTGYIMGQVIGARNSKCSGYTFWNARGDYKIIKKTFSRPENKQKLAKDE